jgi:phosphoenolpyruvate-protein phosphotransferase
MGASLMSTGATYHGKPLSPGLGKGKAFVYRTNIARLGEFYEIVAADVAAECQRIDNAAEQIARDLTTLAESAAPPMGACGPGVFQAHKMIALDSTLLDEIKKEVEEQVVSAGSAVRAVFRRWERRFRAMEAESARAKADDMQDLMRRFVRTLAGVRSHALEGMPPGSVLVASRLMPTDIVPLLQRQAAAVVLDADGIASHAVIFARECGLPCVGGIPVDDTYSGQRTLVDGYDGCVTIDPDSEQRQAFEATKKRYERKQARARVRANEPAITRGGKTIGVFANVGRVDDARTAVANGADGIGLYRIEQLYMGLRTFPAPSMLRDELRKTLAPAQGLPVVVRLLDVGADKGISFGEIHREPNPALGCRGIRFLLKHPDLLQAQLDALLQLAADFDLRILVPMVTLSSDMYHVYERLQTSAARMKITSVPKLGAMIETPAAVLAAGEIARWADFLSVGTNDLTQYTFAADRQNPDVAPYFDDAHAVIFRLLEIIRQEAPQLPLCACGELAGRPDVTARMLSRGVTSLSVSPPCVLEIKQAVREFHG